MRPIDAEKASTKLHRKPSVIFEEGLAKAIDRYLENKNCAEHVTNRKYRAHYQKHHGKDV